MRIARPVIVAASVLAPVPNWAAGQTALQLPKATVEFRGPGTRLAEGQAAAVELVLAVAPNSAALLRPVSVELRLVGASTARIGEDFQEFTRTITFPAGAVSGDVRTVTLTTLQDGKVEPPETIQIELAEPVTPAVRLGERRWQAHVMLDDDTHQLLTVDHKQSNSILTSVNPTSGRAVRWSGWSVAGFAFAGPVELHAPSGTLYLYERLTRELLTIDPEVGIPSVVGTLPRAAVGLATHPETGELWATVDGDWTEGYTQLARIDRATAEITIIGGTAWGVMDIAWAGGQLYAICDFWESPTEAALVRLDPATGAPTFVGYTGRPVKGLAWNAARGKLVSTGPVDGIGQALLEIDRATGAATVVGGAGAGVELCGITSDSAGALTSASAQSTTRAIYRIDGQTGGASQVGIFGMGEVTGLAHDASLRRTFAIGDGQLVVVDPDTGVTRWIGAVRDPAGALYGDIESLVFAQHDRMLYGIVSASSTLLRINPASASATVVAASFQPRSLAGSGPQPGLLYGLVGGRTVHSINPATGASTPVFIVAGAVGHPFLTHLVHDSENSCFYTRNNSHLHRVNTATGAAVPIGAPPSIGNVGAMTLVPERGFLLCALTWGGPRLGRMDPATASIVDIDGVGRSGVYGLAAVPGEPTIYMLIAPSGDRLVRMDLRSGEMRDLGDIGADSIGIGLAYDPAANRLYTHARWAGSSDFQLVSINPETAQGSLVAPSTAGPLAFDPGRSVLYGIERYTDDFLEIDPATGAPQTIGPVGFHVTEIAYSRGGLVIHALATSPGGGVSLVRIDRSTGAGSPPRPTTLWQPRGLSAQLPATPHTMQAP